MSNPLISIIVPIYNVEKYLKRCVDSLISQTYSSIEVILVDDGSTDESGIICDNYALGESGVCTVIHKKNGGQSSARNAGLLAARGEYIGFVDSDDWVSSDMYAYMLAILQSNNAEAAQINYCHAFCDQQQAVNTAEKLEIYCGKDILQYYMTTSTHTGSYSVWRCLFKKNVLEGFTFRNGKINEDIDYKYIALSRCQRFVASNQIKYFYFQGRESTSSGMLRKKDYDLYEAANELWKLTKNEDYGSIRFLGEVKKARTAFSLLSKIAYFGIDERQLDKKETIRELSKENRRHLKVLMHSPMTRARKVLAVMFAVNFSCAQGAVKLMKKTKGI